MADMENTDDAIPQSCLEEEAVEETGEEAGEETGSGAVLEPKGLSKRQQKKAAKAARRQEMRKARRAEERQRKSERRKRAREEGVPIATPPRKLLKTQGLMASSSSKQRVAIDCSFDEMMSEADIKKTFSQLGYCYAANRRSAAPFQLYFTSFNSHTAQIYQSRLGSQVVAWRGGGEWGEEAVQGGEWDVHRRSEEFGELFEAEEIVYLTAEAEATLQALDEAKVYVIGGLVDHNSAKGLCELRARQRGFATARLPIDHFLQMKTRKVLTINHVFEILLHFAASGDWEKALLSVIPQRKEAVSLAPSAALPPASPPSPPSEQPASPASASNHTTSPPSALQP